MIFSTKNSLFYQVWSFQLMDTILSGSPSRCSWDRISSGPASKRRSTAWPASSAATCGKWTLSKAGTVPRVAGKSPSFWTAGRFLALSRRFSAACPRKRRRWEIFSSASWQWRSWLWRQSWEGSRPLTRKGGSTFQGTSCRKRSTSKTGLRCADCRLKLTRRTNLLFRVVTVLFVNTWQCFLCLQTRHHHLKQNKHLYRFCFKIFSFKSWF